MMTVDTVSGNQAITEIRTGGQKYLQSLYDAHRKEFVKWSLKYFRLDEDVAVEIYQQTFIAFYYNIKEGKLTELKSSVKTYLFAIGKNLMREHFKSKQKFVDTPEENFLDTELDDSIMAKYENAGLKETIKEYLQKIGEPCKTVIELYYFRHFSMDAIANRLNYKTEQIAAKRKFICLKQLKSLMTGNL
ncbi:sigma-70 family RNA polymerase sigma factor [Chondrinema litorale]|uniref:sigma-70 family RNA polymerase sigma factor n=1 Tax=Chondrinema litorale TaxID=2994555 RepID=UPI002543AE69|nr:sigma-70 family RNA polymerase sigma factor [Chondrinema litorale]UZR97807.1 sigma-70 family RNA polymerase sigma factor [Chondrinema litorale]